MRIQRCKGTRDLSPGEMSVFRLIEGMFRESCRQWGYEEVKTPTLEYLNLFTSAGTLTSGMLGKVYSFLDWDGWSGERVVLRPDGTIPIARLYIDSMADRGLAKLFYVTNIFIFEETGKETRERWQCGAEIIGKGSPVSDAELISLSRQVLEKLGLKDTVLRLSHAGLVKALLARLGLSPEEQTRVFDQILDGDVKVLDKVRTESPEMESALLPLLNLKGQSSGFLKNLKGLAAQHLPDMEPYLDDFINTVNILEAMGLDYQIDIASGAGFEYYTGIVFQFFIGEEKVGGGGRYDDLIPAMGGRDIPASGFALYLDRLMNLVKPEMISGLALHRVLVRVNQGETGALQKAFTVAESLRRAGYVAEIDLGSQEPAGLKWILDVRSAAPRFTLEDRVKSGSFEVKTIEEVLSLLEERCR
ncbi:ATP phosphoribosyltransferase regulatory subunit [Chloroflexota bacterium]